MIHAIVEFDERERFLRRHRVARDLGDQRDVLLRRQARDQVVELEDEADRVAAESGEFVLVGAGQVDPAIGERAGGRHIESAEDVEQRGFSAAGRAEQYNELTFIKLEVHTTSACTSLSPLA